MKTPTERFRAWSRANPKTVFSMAARYGQYSREKSGCNRHTWVISHLRDIDRYLIDNAEGFKDILDSKWPALWRAWLEIVGSKEGNYGMREPMSAEDEQRHYAGKRTGDTIDKEAAISVGDILRRMKNEK